MRIAAHLAPARMAALSASQLPVLTRLGREVRVHNVQAEGRCSLIRKGVHALLCYSCVRWSRYTSPPHSAWTWPVSMQKGSVTSLLPPSALAGKRMLMHVSAMADRVLSTTIHGCSPRCAGSAISCMGGWRELVKGSVCR